MDLFITIIVAVVIIAVIVAMIYDHVREKRRREELRKWARLHGWRFDSSNNSFIAREYPTFDRFHRGSNRYAYNMIQGSHGERSFRAFDYHYETTTTDSKGRRSTTHYYFSVLILESGLPLKPLDIRPERFFDKVKAFFGKDDINFESAEFSRTFYVDSPDRRWAYDVIHQETMEFILKLPRYWIEFHESEVIVFRDCRRLSVTEYGQALQLAGGILDRLPASVVNELRGAVQWAS